MAVRPERNQICRSRNHRMIAGVCGGIAEYFGLDPTIVRIAFVIGALVMAPMSAPLVVLLYSILAMLLPLEPTFS